MNIVYFLLNMIFNQTLFKSNYLVLQILQTLNQLLVLNGLALFLGGW
jgi:hypothetical protein